MTDVRDQKEFSGAKVSDDGSLFSGGGFGDPAARDTAAHAEDIAGGYVTG